MNNKIHPKKLAVEYSKLKTNQQVIFLSNLTNVNLVMMFKFLEDKSQMNLYDLLDIKRKRELLDLLSIDDLKEFIDLYEDEVTRSKIIDNLKKNRRNEIIKRRSFAFNTVASIMSPHYKVININLSIKEATNHVITTSNEHDHLELIFIVDNYFKYIGTITLKELISSRPSSKLVDLVDESTPVIEADYSPKKAALMLMQYDEPTLPVINRSHEIIGIFTYDDAFDILQDDYETTYEKLTTIGDFDYTQSPINRTKNRISWLLISLILNVVIVIVLSYFSNTLETFVILVAFQPLILDMSGNIGTQSLGSTILKLNKQNKDLKLHIKKELTVSIINTIVMTLLASIVVYLFLLINNSSENHFLISLVVGISVFIGLFISALFGLFIPIILNKIGIDERVASGPLLTTINDLTAIGAYLITATLLLM